MVVSTDTTLQEIQPRKIGPNPDNPRLIFRESEMTTLRESILEVGIKVPLSVYREGQGFVLIDGERRWRCAVKLNLRSVPAIVQPRPGKLENILTMFNIHNVRSAWDLMPTAYKLQEVQELLVADGKRAAAKDLAGITGMPLASVRRALELLDLPKRYRDLLMAEAEKPRDEQKIKVDLFIEINKAKSTIRRYTPDVLDEVGDEQFVDAMVEKYTSGSVPSVTSFREMSRMARAERAGEDRRSVEPALLELVRKPRLRISEAYEKTVGDAYTARDVATRAASLTEKLRQVRRRRVLSPEAVDSLAELREEIDRLLG